MNILIGGRKMNIPSWLKDLEERLRLTLASSVRDIAAVTPGIKVGIFSSTWGRATGANGYIVYLSCGWPETDRKEVDEVALEISFSHVDSAPTFSADVCWGHPSGYVEAEFSAVHTPLSAQAIERLFSDLPRLVSALQAAVERGHPKIEEPIQPPQTTPLARRV
ncbi:MAG TPA: hypothetical protein VG734_23365 [Lacunisphaera sp.]|nr:hypothetical protein [Lacunisphaera sp.]